MTPKNQIHPPGPVPQILLPSVGAYTPVCPPYRRSSIRRGGVLPRPFCRYARHCRSTHSFHPCSVGRAALTPPPFNRTPCKNPVIARPAHTRVSRSASPIHKKIRPHRAGFFRGCRKNPPGFSKVLVTSSAPPRPCAGRPHFPPWWPSWRRSG